MELISNDIYEALDTVIFLAMVALFIMLFISFLSVYGFCHYTKRLYEEGSKITLWIGLLFSAAGIPGSGLLFYLMLSSIKITI